MTLRPFYIVAMLLGGTALVAAQKQDENIGTEVVNVVKPYTPTISDAFKVKETPVLDDEETTDKEEIKYQIFSFPVASTFTPAKGRAASVDKEEKARLFANYLTLGFGNYSNANAELFVNHALDDNSYVGGMLRHFSSQGGIKEAYLEDKFSDTSLDLGYGYNADNMTWNVDAGFKTSTYNWYGVVPYYLIFPDPNHFDGVDPKHTFNRLYGGTRVTMKNSFFKSASFRYDRLWGDYNISENRIVFKPSFAFEIGESKVKLDAVIDYLGASFDSLGPFYIPELGDGPSFGYTIFGAKPSYTIFRNDWTIDIGAAIYYSSDMKKSDSKLAIYPAIHASLKVVGDLMVFYTGAEGEMQQNSYSDLANQNPFIRPGVTLVPTDRKYDIFAGLKGKLASMVSYNVRASFINEGNKPIFLHIPNFDSTTPVSELPPYDLGNSFAVLYDDVKTVRLFGELKADFSKTVSASVNGTYSIYNAKMFDNNVLNLPTIQLGTSLDVDISKKWYTGLRIFYVGGRLDGPSGGIHLDPYFDANAHVGYRHNERWSAFLKLNNIANQAYEKWLNYPVQSFQVMAGANYKFDF